MGVVLEPIAVQVGKGTAEAFSSLKWYHNFTLINQSSSPRFLPFDILEDINSYYFPFIPSVDHLFSPDAYKGGQVI
jgi:hypothetical protein